jgi:hypothetical protein
MASLSYDIIYHEKLVFKLYGLNIKRNSMTRIFISYRRADSAGYVGRLHAHLKEHFGSDHVFMDTSTINPGDVFPEVIKQALSECDILLAVIGPAWLTIVDATTGKRRLDNPDDYVCLEVATGLKRGIRLIPLLVDQARMPIEKELPPVLMGLEQCNALEINNLYFDQQMTKLVGILEKDLGVAGTKYSLKVTQAPSSIRLRNLVTPNAPPVIDTHERLVTIGRAPKNMVHISDSGVSWEHGQIILRRDEYYYCHLSDSQSTILRRSGDQHMFRAGRKEERSLRNQDRLTISGTTFIIEFDLISEDSGYTTTSKKPDATP